MRNNFVIIIFILISYFLASCSKENQKRCWVLVSLTGGIITENPSQEICGLSSNEMHERFDGINYFFPATDPRFCWRFHDPGSTTYYYLLNNPQYIIDKFITPTGKIAMKIDCNTVCRWELEQKSQSKITGQYSNIFRLVETYTSADTCSSLYVNRVILYRETPDSLITRTFTKKFLQ